MCRANICKIYLKLEWIISEMMHNPAKEEFCDVKGGRRNAYL